MNTHVPDLKELLRSGVHFGHSVGRWHPKAEWYIHSARSGVHVIDLLITQQRLHVALTLIEKLSSEGKTILFVGTKRQAQDIVEAEAKRAGMPYVTQRWLGGLLTNFDTIHPMLERYRRLLNDKETGAFEKYTKKERVRFQKMIDKRDGLLSGIRTLTKLPDVLFVIDVRKENTAIQEAKLRGVPVIAVCDTNINPEYVTYPIPGNDDAVKSIALFARLVADAVIAGKATVGIAPVIGEKNEIQSPQI